MYRSDAARQRVGAAASGRYCLLGIQKLTEQAKRVAPLLIAGSSPSNKSPLFTQCPLHVLSSSPHESYEP